jgi:hypothetical protein
MSQEYSLLTTATMDQGLLIYVNIYVNMATSIGIDSTQNLHSY